MKFGIGAPLFKLPPYAPLCNCEIDRVTPIRHTSSVDVTTVDVTAVANRRLWRFGE